MRLKMILIMILLTSACATKRDLSAGCFSQERLQPMELNVPSDSVATKLDYRIAAIERTGEVKAIIDKYEHARHCVKTRSEE